MHNPSVFAEISLKGMSMQLLPLGCCYDIEGVAEMLRIGFKGY